MAEPLAEYARIDARLGGDAFFTTRDGGADSVPDLGGFNLAIHACDNGAAVAANRALLNYHLGTGAAYMNQVHGNDVERVSDALGQPEADALVTDTPGVALAVLVADCVPILLRADNGAVGVAHAGRRGVESNVVAAAVAALRDLGAGTVTAAIGPAICGRCYEVPAEMRDAVEAAVPGAASETRWGTPALDLPSAVASQLEAAGVRVAMRADACTFEDDGFFSHRRDAPTGRQAGIIRCVGGVSLP